MYILQLQKAGTQVGEAEIARLTQQYGLDKPMYMRYFMWIWNIIRYGDFGRSFQWGRPVSEVIGERIMLTMVISILTLIFTWAVAIPIGIYSATHQYSLFDHIFTFLGFIGLATPNFLLALMLVWLSFTYLHIPITGLFSSEYMDAAWSIAKVADMFKHVWVAVIVVGTAGAAGIIRVMRGCLLDELRKQYVITARAKGVSERKLLFKYPVRIAINPLISTIGWLLPQVVSGTTITAIVLNLPTTGPVLFRALMFQDMYLAGSFILILSTLTVIGSLISDILLAWLDPRIRYKGVSE
ncbi:MAG: ABC transporter permease [Thermoproteales archaeon]|nr:ABC transporter permease [Thermoproteales archaeon]